MRVVFLEDVQGVARGGDVKEVKNGFARNYLLPKKLAVPATHNALQRIERLAKEAEDNRLKTIADMAVLGEALEGKQINIEMRAGAGGRLYGSVTNVIVADELSKLVDREIDRRTVEIDEPIRELGTFDVNVRLHPEVTAGIKVLVYAMGTDPDAEAKAAEEAESAEAVAEDGAEAEVAETAVAVAEPEAEVVEEETEAAEDADEDETIEDEVEQPVAEVSEEAVAEDEAEAIAEEDSEKSEESKEEVSENEKE